VREIHLSHDVFGRKSKYGQAGSRKAGRFLILGSTSKELIRQSSESLAGHPVYGASWESLCLENIIPFLRSEVQYSFFRTAKGAEIDLVLEAGNKRMAVEFRVSSAPKVQGSGMHCRISKGIRYVALLIFFGESE
jgi:predicted AAA+ superfamily ATPase